MRRFYTILFIFLSLMYCVSFAVGQDKGGLEPDELETDWMPDANLRSVVSTELGLEANEALTKAVMPKLTLLSATSKGIDNITGLEYATGLSWLWLGRNSISDVSALENLTGLEHLYLQDNSISDVSVLSDLTSLTTLYLANNPILNTSPLYDLLSANGGSITAIDIVVYAPWDINADGNVDASDVALVTAAMGQSGDDILNARTDVNGDGTVDNADLVLVNDNLDTDTSVPSVSLSVPEATQKGAFDVVITFTKRVSGFDRSDVLVSGIAIAHITAWSTTDNTVFTATITPMTSGEVTLRVGANVATDAGGNNNTASETQRVRVDMDAPSVSISVPEATQNGAFNVTITFTEGISGFEQSDLTVSGTADAGITGWGTIDDRSFTATITPTTDGTVVFSVGANVATDVAGNNNTASDSQTVSVDMTQPEVSISVPSVPQNGAFDVTITFTESVSDFEQTDLTVAGTARAGITAWSTTDNTVFTATITPVTSGDVTLSVLAGVATDGASKDNIASETQRVRVDMDAPSVSISVPDATQNGAFNVTITFTEVAFDFEQSDLTLSGTATASITGWETTDDRSFTATITPTTSGTVVVSVAADVATDVAGNNNTASDSQTVTVTVTVTVPAAIEGATGQTDTSAPSVSLSVPEGVQTGAFDVTITFTESVSDFEESDLTLSGTATASITAWVSSTDNTVFTATITPTTSGDVVLSVAAGVATDAANNNNTASEIQTVTVTVKWMPDANLRTAVRAALGLNAADELTKSKMTELTTLNAEVRRISSITGLEHATNLTSLDIDYNSVSDLAALKDLTNLTYLDLSENSISDLTPLSELTNLTYLDLSENSISDLSVLPKLTSLTKLSLSLNPLSDLSVLSKLTSLTKLSLEGNSLSDLSVLSKLTSLTSLHLHQNLIIDVSPLSNLTNLTYLDLSRNSIIDVSDLSKLTSLTTLSLLLNSISDVSALSSLTSLTNVTLSSNPISDTSPLYDLLSENGGSITNIDIDVSQYAPWDVNKDENVDASDVALVTAALGQSGADILNSRTDVNGDGTVDADDLALVTDNFPDMVAPDVSISVPESAQNRAFDVVITFTESVSGFEQSDLTVSGTVNASIRAWATTDNTVFTATITPTTSGEVTLSVAADVATDATGNSNTASDSQTVTVDMVAPRVSIAVPEGVQTGAFDVTITFGESVSGFEQADLTVAGTATASITAWVSSTDNTVFTATITPTTSGKVTLSVAGGIATDAAGNNNAAARRQPVTVDFAATWMSDANLRTAVRAALGLSAADTITQAKMTELTSLEAKGRQMKDLTGLEYATNLTSLNLGENLISDLTPISQLTSLTTLHLYNNLISDLTPLSKLTSLTKMYLYNNSISDLTPLSKLTNLWALRLQGNSISDVSKLSKLTNLIVLYLHDNSISDVSALSDLTSLTTLYLKGNPISDTSPLYDLLSASGGSITTIDISVSQYAPWDVNKDENVDASDVALVTAALGQSGADILDPRTDVNGDGTVDNADLTLVTGNVTDASAPSVSLSVPETTQTGAFDVVITFTESVSGFDRADVSVSGTATAGITGWSTTDNTVFTATITPTTSGTVVLSVAAGVATDAANNANTASDSQTVTVDVDAPSVSLSLPAGAQNGAFDVTITFSEVVSDFEQADLTLSGTATASITAWATTDNTVFTATITPTTGGTVVLSVAAGVATDAVNNANTASDGQTVSVDMVAPSVSLSVPAGSQTDAFDVVITFTEVVSGFEQTDVSVSGTATASITGWETTDNTVFTATITPTMAGDVVLSVAAGVATDAAGNNNTAADAQTVTVTVEAETVWMPDAALRTVVRETLGLGAEETLTKSKMTELTLLKTAYRLGIINLKGLEHAENLKDLRVNDNSISDISALSELTNLQTLYMGDNSISNISHLSGLTKLATLSLYNNSISDISALSELTSLWHLYLYNNSISDISALSKLTNLRILYLTGNSIDNIDALAGMTNLTSLGLTRNSISIINALSKLTNLTTLELKQNSIIDIASLSGLTRLKQLNLDDNSISGIGTLSGLTRLQELHLNGNSISDITPLSGLTSLKKLWLNDNSLNDIDSLKGLTRLTQLELRNTSISDVSPLSGLTNLTWLRLSRNPLLLDTSPIYDLLSANDGSITSIDIDVSEYAPWDVNEDGAVDASDVALVTAALGQSGDDILDSRTDVNGDGVVDNDDLTLVTDNLDADDDAAAPASMAGIASLLDRAVLESLDPDVLGAELSMLRSKSDGSLKYERAIALLESMLAALRPVETLLLANYPNPFNPETWIPYHLANAGDVVITIYDVRGSVIRRLELGHQREGYYTLRSRAAYWDGRNNMGERVASGIYFYQLETENTSLLRKMVILK